MRGLTDVEAATLQDNLHPFDPNNLGPDVDLDPIRRAFLNRLVQRGLMRETIAGPFDVEGKQVSYIIWTVTPLGRIALQCYKSEQNISVFKS
jgi:hypothetical protein